ncbi:MAG: hypothetical protein JWM77_142 [Rhodospirillales bacterium]|nr:hypothetical protein [Rhodospirillales bacterium]
MTEQHGAAPSNDCGRALRIVDDAWSELRQAPGWGAQALNQRPSLFHVSFDSVQRRANRGRKLGAEIAQLDLASLPHDLALTVRLANLYAGRWAREDDWYGTVFDPAGVGFFGLFAPTPYCGGGVLSNVLVSMQKMALHDAADLDRYLAFVADFARLVREMVERTRGQAEGGTYMPQVQLVQTVPLLQGLQQRALAELQVVDARLPARVPPSFQAELTARLRDVAAAFDEFVALLGETHAQRAPETVGMAQYRDGPEIYAALIRQHTTLDLTARDVHAMGLDRMAQIRSDMQAARTEAGFSGSDQAWRESLDAQPRWRAANEEEVTRLFRVYIERIKPHLGAYFSFQPKAGHDAAALPDSLAGAMSFGFYDPPKADQPIGRYLYNARNLTQRGLFNLGALNYHELMPGHHLHFASQWENEGLHPLRANCFINAFNEGWAEYAATLAGEMGMYELPDERFGRLVMDAFLTCRLVVDTGMNALGWSLEQARVYMRENSFMSDAEIRSESVRYSCDIPAQSLAYKIGDVALMRLRTRMRDALGTKFDIRRFHDAVLRPGALPLNLVEAEVDRTIAQLAA